MVIVLIRELRIQHSSRITNLPMSNMAFLNTFYHASASQVVAFFFFFRKKQGWTSLVRGFVSKGGVGYIKGEKTEVYSMAWGTQSFCSGQRNGGQRSQS